MNIAAFATVGLYAGLKALALLWLALSTASLRGKHKVSIGDGEVKHLKRVMRGHANAVENIAILLILMLVIAALGTLVFLLHGFGILLTVNRLFHGWHFI